MISGDASEVYALAADLTEIGPKSVPAARQAMDDAGLAFARQWASNARGTAGAHGVHYPDSIDSELVFDIGGVSVDVGPNADKKQGSMGRGFEFGSENQPPHLDGLRALDDMTVRAERLVESAMGSLFR